MSDIKARSWNESENKFFYFKNGRYYSDENFKNCISERICDQFSWLDANEFTGIIVKFKRELYALDIFEDGSICVFIGNRYAKVWTSKDKDGHNHWEDITENDVIIGNCKENKELLK